MALFIRQLCFDAMFNMSPAALDAHTAPLVITMMKRALDVTPYDMLCRRHADTDATIFFLRRHVA